MLEIIDMEETKECPKCYGECKVIMAYHSGSEEWECTHPECGHKMILGILTEEQERHIEIVCDKAREIRKQFGDNRFHHVNGIIDAIRSVEVHGDNANEWISDAVDFWKEVRETL